MNAVRQALYAALAADAPLTGLLSSATAIYHQRAPQDAETPFVVFQKQAGNPRRTFTDAYAIELWLVKAVDRGSSANQAEQIAAAIDALLDGATLAITGQTPMSLRRDSDVDYPEDDGAETYHHAGGVYRLFTQTT